MRSEEKLQEGDKGGIAQALKFDRELHRRMAACGATAWPENHGFAATASALTPASFKCHLLLDIIFFYISSSFKCNLLFPVFFSSLLSLSKIISDGCRR